MTFEQHMRSYARRLLREALERHGGRIQAAARELGINRTHFYRVLRHYGMEQYISRPVEHGNEAWRALARDSHGMWSQQQQP